MEEPSVVNVVGGGDIYRELDLAQVSKNFPHLEVEYNPESFAAVIIRYASPKGTVMLYSSGKYSLAGSKSISKANEVNEKFIEQLEKMLGEELNREEFEIRYLVATADCKKVLNLNEMALALGIDQIEYEPEQFPGLFYRPPEEDWFCILFSSGKLIFSGAQDETKLRNISSRMEKLLQSSTGS